MEGNMKGKISKTYEQLKMKIKLIRLNKLKLENNLRETRETNV